LKPTSNKDLKDPFPQEAGGLFGAIFEQSPVGVAIAGNDQRFLHVNDALCRMLGYTRDELLLLKVTEVIHPDERLGAADGVNIMIANPVAGNSATRRWQRKDGTFLPVTVTTAPICGPDGSAVYGLGIVHDDTARHKAEQDQRELEAQVHQAQKFESLGILAGGIAHDFNNLLTVIIGQANLAMMDLGPESPALNSLKQIEKASSRAAELCRQMLAFAGKGAYVVETVDLSRLIGESAHLLQVPASKKVLLRYQLAEGLPAIDADPAQLRQIVMNLVINAAEATGETEGFITVSTGKIQFDGNHPHRGQVISPPANGQYVYLEVADTGCGMDERTKPRIFDPFFTTKFAGRGLGLAALLGIVRSHKGGVSVESEPGRGTTFRVLFPVSAKAKAPAQSGAAPLPWHGTGTILLVDDEDLVRQVSAQMLERCGYTVLSAADGREALEVFRARRSEIACVLLDLAMPHMDGHETFLELRRIQPDVRVLLATGFSDQEIAKRFANAGLNGFIAKPYRLETLGAKLREVLAPRG
jgi:PAS domain S-box-containing protein